MARNPVNPKKGNQIRNWQNATHMRSVSGMIAGMENVGKIGSKKELSIEEQSNRIRQSIKKCQKRLKKLRAWLRTPKDLKSFDQIKSGEDCQEKIRNLEKLINLKISNLSRLARLQASNMAREQARQKTLRDMQKGIFPDDNSLVPTAIVRKIKKAGKPATNEVIFTRNIPVSLQKEIGNPIKKRFQGQPKGAVDILGGRKKPEDNDE